RHLPAASGPIRPSRPQLHPYSKAFPQSLPAERAKEHQGLRAFYVQLAAFNPGAAKPTADSLRKQGQSPVTVRDPKGQELLRIGPLPTYAQAVSIKNRYTRQFPSAMVIP